MKPFDSLSFAQDHSTRAPLQRVMFNPQNGCAKRSHERGSDRVEWLSEPPHDCADYMEAIQDATHLGG